jgi:hypothetical protein
VLQEIQQYNNRIVIARLVACNLLQSNLYASHALALEACGNQSSGCKVTIGIKVRDSPA